MTVAELVTLACQLESREFAALFDHPMLLHVGMEPEPDKTPFGFSTRVVDLSTLDMASQRGVDWLHNDAYPVKKSAGDPYQSWISVGRARSSDVRIESSHVSKFHGYFAMVGADHAFTDAGSKNGSWVDGLRLEPRTPVTLPNDCFIVLGTHLLHYFGNPKDLWSYLGDADSGLLRTSA